jgi:hypothetical protein
MSPIPPLGPYPQDRLCGQAGITPTRAKTRIMSKIVPSDMLCFSLKKDVIQEIIMQRSAHFHDRVNLYR